MLEDGVSTDDHQEALAWLDDSLAWARPRSRTELLKLVRDEVLLDLELPESPPQTPAWANGTFPGAHRSV